MTGKMIILDVDGTICAGSFLPPSAVRAIRKIREDGNIAVFFTGRPYTHIDPAVISIGFDGCVCTMGAYIRIGDEVVQNLKPSPENVKSIIKIVIESRLDAAYESEKGIRFAFNGELPGFLNGLKKHFQEMGLETDGSIDEEGFTFDKLCLWKNESADFGSVEEQLGQYLELVGKKENMEEWTVKGLSSRDSIEKLKEHFNIQKENCYAAGDSITDLPMLEAAEHTIAMGQGHEELKSQVEYVAAPIDDDGLAKAMLHYGLIDSL